MDDVARVFPRKTNASPDDDRAFFGPPPSRRFFREVRVSVTFSYDIDRGEELAEQWRKVSPIVDIGGPALGDRGEDFTPGEYLKKGYVITSRGCPNIGKCWFCDVPRREGGIRELPITEGCNLLDSNILACSDGHVRKVFGMLRRQKERGRRIELTGGLEAARLTDFHIKLLWGLRPKQMFFAYDTPDDIEPLFDAGRRLRYADFSRNHLRCYVLVGHPRDDISSAEKRCLEAWRAGFMPMAMVWRGKNSKAREGDWIKFSKLFSRPALTRNYMKRNFYG